MAVEATEDLLQRNRDLQQRLDEAEEILNALRSGDVDAIVVSGSEGERVYTLKGADEAYRVMVEAMANGALTVAPDGLIIFSNQRFASLVARPLERVMGSRLQEFVSQDYAHQLELLLSGKGARKAELRFRTDQGALVPVYVSVDNFGLDGVQHLCVIITDLTQQKQNEATVAAEKVARSILEQAAEAIIVLDPEGRVTRASESADLLAGQRIVRRMFDDVFQIRLNNGEEYSFQKILSTTGQLGKFSGVEATATMRNGREAQVILSAAKLSTNGSDPLGCVVTMTDITERTLAEQVLRDSEARFRRLCDSNIIGIISADRERILEANDVFLDLLGYSRADLEQGRLRWQEMTPPEYRRLGERAIEELAATGSCKPFEKEYFRADGSRVSILIGATLLERSPMRWICFILDLTERKRLEKKLAEKQKLESVGLLAGGIAHDFNNLLVGVLGNASLAREMLPPDSPVIRPLDGVVQASERAAHLTRQLLAYSGKGQFVLQDVNLSGLAAEVVNLAQSTISDRIMVHLDLAPDLPPVKADAGQMQQVIMNLVMNAAEAIGDRPALIMIRTALQSVDSALINELHDGAEIEPGHYVALEVRDTGSGMDEATIARIFDPFFTTKFTGRGLGLAAVAGVVRSHRGAIKVSSSPGSGSTFLVLLPPAGGIAPKRQLPEKSAAAETGTEGTVLVVDDEELVLRTAKASLERRGFRVLQAESGAKAVEILRREAGRVSVVLLDWSMPGMTGEEMLPELRKITPNVQVIVSSGYSESEIKRVFSGQEVAGFLQKPYTSARLAEKVKSAILRS